MTTDRTGPLHPCNVPPIRSWDFQPVYPAQTRFTCLRCQTRWTVRATPGPYGSPKDELSWVRGSMLAAVWRRRRARRAAVRAVAR